jgi:lipopolysaccharide transport system ATP-binding protein
MHRHAQVARAPGRRIGEARPFVPRALRVCSHEVSGRTPCQPATIEIDYRLEEAVTGLRLGIYLMTARGEYVFASFDTDDPELFEAQRTRPAGAYTSRCTLPADLLNEGRYVLGINASSYRIQRYFQDEQALTFNVDAAGAPGTHWPEPRLGPIRPRLEWQIETIDDGQALPALEGPAAQTTASKISRDALR